MFWHRKSNGERRSGHLPNYFLTKNSVQNRQFQPFFRISFRILKLKRNLGGGGRKPNISFFCTVLTSIQAAFVPLSTYCTWSKTINWRPEESSRRISFVDNADSSSGWAHFEDGLLLLFLNLLNEVEVLGKRNWSSQVKLSQETFRIEEVDCWCHRLCPAEGRWPRKKRRVIDFQIPHHLSPCQPYIRPILCYHMHNSCEQCIKLSAELSKLKLE